MLLALDTATPAVTVAVADGAEVLAERTTVDARRHGELLAPAIDAVLAEAGVSRESLTPALVQRRVLPDAPVLDVSEEEIDAEIAAVRAARRGGAASS